MGVCVSECVSVCVSVSGSVQRAFVPRSVCHFDCVSSLILFITQYCMVSYAIVSVVVECCCCCVMLLCLMLLLLFCSVLLCL